MADQDRDPQVEAEAPSASSKLEFMGTNEQISALYVSLANAAAEFSPIVNEAEGQIGQRRFTYADLETLVRSTRPALSKHGVAVLQFMTGPDTVGNHRLTTVVAGAGAAIHAHIDYRKAADLKAWGMQTTYLRRYAYRALFQLDGSDDADNEPMPAESRRDARPTPPQAPPKEQKAKQPPREQPKAAEAPAKGGSTPPPPPPKTQAADATPPATAAVEQPPATPATASSAPGGVASAPEKRPSQPPPLPPGEPPPDMATVDAELMRLLKERRPVIGEKTFAKFDKELVAQWTLHVTGKQKDQITPEDKVKILLPALRALPMRQMELPS